MEADRTVKFGIRLQLGISLILFVGFGICLDDPSHLNEVGNYYSDVSAISRFPSFKKYIMESYDERHKSFLESDFNDFLARELPAGQCKVLSYNRNLVPRLSLLQRNLIGEGSHRRLSFSSNFIIQSDTSVSELPAHLSEIIVIEKLPLGIFADPFELQHLVHLNVFSDVAMFGDTNLEQLTIFSNRSVVGVHKDVGSNVLFRSKNGLDVDIELPLHARYPHLDESGYSKVRFVAPNLFLHCRMEEEEVKPSNESCLFLLENAEEAEIGSGEVIWRVPAGIKAHSRIVSLVTFLSALFSAISIVFTALTLSHVKQHKSRKQSEY